MSDDQPVPHYVTIPHLAEILDMDERSVRRWIDQGILKPLRPPGAKVIRVDLNEAQKTMEDHHLIRCSHPGCRASGWLPPLWRGTSINVYFCPDHYEDDVDGDAEGAAGNTANPVGSANTTVEYPGKTSEDLGTSPDSEES